MSRHALASALSVLIAAAAGGAALAFVVFAAIEARAAEPAALPDSPAGRCAAAFIQMWNDGSEEAVEKFESEYASAARRARASAAERAERFAELRTRWGELTPVHVSGGAGPDLVVTVRRRTGEHLALEFAFSADEPGRLEGVGIGAGPGVGVPAPLAPEKRAETVRAAAKAVEGQYVYPEVGRRMAEAVIGALERGEYDDVKDEVSLAMRLTRDMRAVSNDRHLGIRAMPQDRGPAPEMAAGEPDPMARENYLWRHVELLDGNIGYIRFDGFMPGPEAEKTAAAALAFVARSDALIFDMRHNGGGHPEMVRFVTSYLFDTPTHLNDMVDRSGAVTEEYWTLEDVPGERLARDLPVYVLTSGQTFSGAEEFAYNLKNLKRAVLIGETTGGGAHPVRGVRLNGRFMIGVPYLRARNPISGTNWEGSGVEPDIAVPAGEALDRAKAEARAASERRSGALATP